MLKISRKKPETYKGDILAYFVSGSKDTKPTCVNKDVQKVIRRAFEAGDFKSKEEQTLLFYPDNSKMIAAKRVLVVGLGDLKGKDEKTVPSRAELAERVRKVGGVVAKTAQSTGAKKIIVEVPEVAGLEGEQTAQALSEGLLLGAYQFKKYKEKDEEDQSGNLTEIALSGANETAVRGGMKIGSIGAKAACLARDMANEPGNVWTPESFATAAKEMADSSGLICKVFGKAALKRLGCGGILGVNSGSAKPPAMVTLKYHSSPEKPTLLLVGKGLTFDSGGISIKPSNGMEEMKYDMCGGAAVLAVMQAVGELKPRDVNVIAIVPATENLPGSAALKPGDIITQYGGKTVEVVNTDAEGRLILADALAYGVEQFKPAAVVDLATLTGAVVVALGHHRTGLMGTDDELADKLLQAGENVGEPLWRLPLGPEYRKQIDSKIADIKNVGDRMAGTITAASFLQEFVGDTPWAHLDIAGTAWDFTEKPYIPKGPSGTGVRTLLEFINNYSS